MSIPPAALAAMMEGPALATGLPEGVRPNLDNPPNIAPALYGVTILFLILPTLAVFIRTWCRSRQRTFTIDDYFLLSAWVMYAFCYNVLGFLMYDIAPGVHQWDLRLKVMPRLLHLNHAAGVIYPINILLIKLAILTQFLRLFVPKGQRGLMFWATHALIALNTVFYIVFPFILIFQCRPRNVIWQPWLRRTAKCIELQPLFVFAGAFNLVSNITILLLPQRVIWKLRMPTNRKVGVSAIFLVGIFACAAAAVRLYYVITLESNPDRSYWGVITGMTSFAEMCFGFLVACAPTAPKAIAYVSQLDLVSKVSSTIRSILRSTRSSAGIRTRSSGTQQSRYNAGFDAGFNAGLDAAQRKRPSDASEALSYELEDHRHVDKGVYTAGEGADSARSLVVPRPEAQIVRTVETAVVFETRRDSELGSRSSEP